MLADAGRMEERMAIRVSHDFSGGLAGAVGIVAAEGVFFAISPHLFVVLVALVAGHDDHHARFLSLADGFEQVDGAEDIGGKGLAGAA